MMLPKERIIYLLEAYTSKKATALEEQELMEWMQEAQEDSELKVYVQNVWNEYKEGTEFKYVPWDEMFGRVIQNDKVPVIPIRPAVVSGKPHAKRIPWYRIAAAAAIIVLIVTGYVLWVTSKKSEVGSQKTEVAKTNDVPAPKENRAVITLADGTKVYLDSAGNGVLAQQSGVSVMKSENGEISYRSQGAGHREGEMQYNMAYNPRGSKVLPLTLIDGTKVWLNAESSLKYPAAFAGNTREVEITGEAYFEVTHDASRPFHVKKGNTDVTVLGTHFNVNAYDDEDALRVTLLEGSVKVAGSRSQVTIKPGEQAVLRQAQDDKPGTLSVVSNVDVDEVMAWKNGMFQFNRTSIQSIMKQVERWYDVDVEYKTNVSEKDFTGGIARKENVSQVLKMLETTGAIHFYVEGRKVTVMQ